MSHHTTTQSVLASAPLKVPKALLTAGLAAIVVGGAGLALALAVGSARSIWVALLVSTVMVLGLAVAGTILSAIFQLTHARWGQAYRRLGEGAVVLMPIALVGLLVVVVGGGAYLPWQGAEHLNGGKHVWLTRGFWDLRVIACTLLCYSVALVFLYYSVRKDFCHADVARRFSGLLSRLVSKNISDTRQESERCEQKLDLWAPIVAMVYAVTFTFLAVDLIMALEPEWFSTLFGAWFFIGHIFALLALLALVSLVVRARLPMGACFSELGQRDMATLLFAFVLVNTDFFWSQFLTIWYGNIPEETGYLIKRTIDPDLPWAQLSWLTLAAFFIIPFVALLFRKVKHSRFLLGSVAVVVVFGVFSARFMEIAPALIDIAPGSGLQTVAIPLVAALMVFVGFMGVGAILYGLLFTQVPMMRIEAAEEVQA